MPPPPSDLQSRLTTSLQSRLSLSPSTTFLTTLLSSLPNPNPPYPTILSLAQSRLLASDITTSLSLSLSPPPRTPIFPAGINSVTTKELRLQTDVPVQVLDIIDVWTSKWSQIEAIERIDRGEEVRGREVIRTVRGATDDDDENTNDDQEAARPPLVAGNARTNQADATALSSKRSLGPHRLLLQDASKQNVLAFELTSIPQVFISTSTSSTSCDRDGDGMAIGCKLILKAGTLVRRGMIMLQPEKVVVLGGKIESWDRKWREERKERLKGDIGREHEEARGGEGGGRGEG